MSFSNVSNQFFWMPTKSSMEPRINSPSSSYSVDVTKHVTARQKSINPTTNWQLRVWLNQEANTTHPQFPEPGSPIFSVFVARPTAFNNTRWRNFSIQNKLKLRGFWGVNLCVTVWPWTLGKESCDLAKQLGSLQRMGTIFVVFVYAYANKSSTCFFFVCVCVFFIDFLFLSYECFWIENIRNDDSSKERIIFHRRANM